MVRTLTLVTKFGTQSLLPDYAYNFVHFEYFAANHLYNAGHKCTALTTVLHDCTQTHTHTAVICDTYTNFYRCKTFQSTAYEQQIGCQTVKSLRGLHTRMCRIVIAYIIIPICRCCVDVGEGSGCTLMLAIVCLHIICGYTFIHLPIHIFIVHLYFESVTLVGIDPSAACTILCVAII